MSETQLLHTPPFLPQRKLFLVLFSDQDADGKAALVAHLAPVREVLTIWSEDDVSAGESILEGFMQAVACADAVLLLLSSDFFDKLSTPLFSQQVDIIRQRHEKKEILVIPLLWRDCEWQAVAWLAGLKALPEGGMAIRAMSEADRDHAFAEIIRNLIGSSTKTPALIDPCSKAKSGAKVVGKKSRILFVAMLAVIFLDYLGTLRYRLSVIISMRTGVSFQGKAVLLAKVILWGAIGSLIAFLAWMANHTNPYSFNSNFKKIHHGDSITENSLLFSDIVKIFAIDRDSTWDGFWKFLNHDLSTEKILHIEDSIPSSRSAVHYAKKGSYPTCQFHFRYIRAPGPGDETAIRKAVLAAAKTARLHLCASQSSFAINHVYGRWFISGLNRPVLPKQQIVFSDTLQELLSAERESLHSILIEGSKL